MLNQTTSTRLPVLSESERAFNLKAIAPAKRNDSFESLKLPPLGNQKVHGEICQESVAKSSLLSRKGHPKGKDDEIKKVQSPFPQSNSTQVLFSRIHRSMSDLVHVGGAQQRSESKDPTTEHVAPKWYSEWVGKAVESQLWLGQSGLRDLIVQELMDLYHSCLSTTKKQSVACISSQFSRRLKQRSEKHLSIQAELGCPSYLAQKKALDEAMFITHRFHRRLQEIWFQDFWKLSFFRNFESEAALPMEPDVFFRLQDAQCRYVHDVLHFEWARRIRDEFVSRSEVEWVGHAQHSRFLASVKCLMGLQLCQLLADVLDKVTNFFEQCHGSSSPVFTLRLAVDSGGRLVFDPDPSSILSQLLQYLRRACDVICSITSLHSDICTDPSYFGSKIVVAARANAILDGPAKRLETVFAERRGDLQQLLDIYRRYEHLFSEPYFEFTSEWTDANAWRRSEKAWQTLFLKSKKLRYNILSLTPSQVTVGIFRIQITEEDMGDDVKTRALLAVPALVSKASSLINHIAISVSERLSVDIAKLRSELDPIYSICNEDSDDPRRLIEIFNSIQSVRGSVEHIRQLGRLLFQKVELLWSIQTALPDDQCAAVLKCAYMAVMVKSKVQEASSRSADRRWIIEEDLFSKRREIDMFVEKFRQSELIHILSFFSTNQVDDYLSYLKAAIDTLEATAQKATEIISAQENIGLPVVSFQLLDETLAKVKLHRLLWDYAANVTEVLKLWKKMVAVDVNVERLNKTSSAWLNDFDTMLHEFPPEKASHQIASLLKGQVTRFSRLVPALRVWTSRSLCKRHWDEIFCVLNQAPRDLNEVTIGDLQSWAIHTVCDQLRKIEHLASSENRASEEIENMIQSWEAHSLPVCLATSGGTSTFIVESFQDAESVLFDHLMRVDQLESQQVSSHNSEKLSSWKKQVISFQNCIKLWVQVQARYLRTLPFFTTNSHEFSTGNFEIFQKADHLWREIMSAVTEGPSWKSVSEDTSLFYRLESIDQDLNRLMPLLQKYFEQARRSCTRLYFLSDDELADVLACEYDDLSLINKYVHYLYPAVRCLEIHGLNRSLCTVISEYGDTLNLIPILPTKNVRPEVWLSALEQKISSALCKEINRARKTHLDSDHVSQWIEMHVEQALLVVYSIYFVCDVERALSSASFYCNELKAISRSKDAIISQCASFHLVSMSTLTRKKLSSMIIMIKNQQSMLENMINAKIIIGVGDFEWQRYVRVHWRNTASGCQEGVDVHVIHRSYAYGMEYSGNQQNMVASASLRQMLNIVGVALGMQVGAAILGPAGAGKSMSIAEMASLFGMPLFLHGCRDDSSLYALHRICKGVAATGYWLCMRNFHSLPTDIIAVIQTSLLSIQHALRSKDDRIDLHGEPLCFPSHFSQHTPKCATFLTMQTIECPTLPEFLRALYRPVYFVIPDSRSILEVMLTSMGIQPERSAILAKKLHILYENVSTELSHIKPGLFSFASLLHSVRYALKISEGQHFDEKTFLQALLASKISSLNRNDLQVLKDSIQDVFNEDREVSNLVNANVNETEDEATTTNTERTEGRSITKAPHYKIKQLHETLLIFRGVFIIGNASTGKSACIKEASKRIGNELTLNRNRPQHINLVYIYPKALTTSRLLGLTKETNPQTTKGLFSFLLDSAGAVASTESAVGQTWIIFDGTVDESWCSQVIDLFSAAESTHLSNRDIFTFPPDVKVLFESLNLASSCPRLVNSCGVIFVPEQENLWLAYILVRLEAMDARLTTAWIQSGDTNFVSALIVLQNLVYYVLKPSLSFVDSECGNRKHVISQMHAVMNLWSLFENMSLQTLKENSDKAGFVGTWLDASNLQSESNTQADKYTATDWIHQYFMFALIWAVGAVLSAADRKKFEIYLRDLCSTTVFVVQANKRTGRKLNHEFKLSTILPKAGSLYDYVYQDLSRTQSGWILWSDTPFLSSFDTIRCSSLNEIVVPTMDYRRYVNLLTWMLFSKRPVLLSGPASVGKTFYFKCAVKRGLERNVLRLTAHLSASTTAENLQKIIEARLELKRMGVLGPAHDCLLVAHIEDLHLPIIENHSPLELIRQFFDRGGWYALNEPVYRHVESVHLIASMQTSEVRRAILPTRLANHFQVLNIVSLNEQDFRSIFQSYLTWYHSKYGFPEYILDLESSIVAASLTVLRSVQMFLKPTPICPQYLFSFHDLKSVLSGMMLQTVENLQVSIDSSPISEHLRLWVHEILRVFYDRISSKKDQTWFLNMMKEVIRDQLHQDFDHLFRHLDLNQSGDVDSEELRFLIFGNFPDESASQSRNHDLKGYDEVQDFSLLLKSVQNYASEYDIQHTIPMQLKITKFNVEHFSRAKRVLQIQSGNALLIGQPGTGKRSIAKLAAHTSGFKCFQFDSSCSRLSWPNILKAATTELFAETTQHVVLVLSAEAIDENGFEDLNCMFNGVEIPGMFSKAEILALVKHVEEGDSQAFADLLDIKRQSLHIFLCIDSTDFLYRSLAKYPFIINRCTIDWFLDLSLSTMTEFAAVYFCQDTIFKDVFEAGDAKNLILWSNFCARFHFITRDLLLQNNQITAQYQFSFSAYSQFLRAFMNLVAKSSEYYQKELVVLEQNLHVFENARDVVNMEHTDLEKETIISLQLDRDELLALENAKAATSDLNTLRKTQEKYDEDLRESETISAQLMNDLDDVTQQLIPRWNECIKILNSLNDRDISKLKSSLSLANFSSACLQTLALATFAVLEGKSSEEYMRENPAMFEQQGTGDIFAPAYHMVASNNFKTRLLSISSATKAFQRGLSIVKSLYLSQNDFTAEEIARACSGAEKIFYWIQALLIYQEEYDIVGNPYTNKLKEISETALKLKYQREQSEITAIELETEISACHKTVENVRAARSECLKRSEIIVARAKRATQVLQAICNYAIDLPKEWRERLISSKASSGSLKFRCLVAAAAITYFGNMKQSSREYCLTVFMKQISESGLSNELDFDICDFLTDCFQTSFPAFCESSGISLMDARALLNAYIIALSDRNQIIIDPCGDARKWILERHASNPPLMLTGKDANHTLSERLKVAMQEGKPILALGSCVINKLAQTVSFNILEKGNKKFILVDNSLVELKGCCRLYMFTEFPVMSNFGFLKDVSLVDFSYDSVGLNACFQNRIIQAMSSELHKARVHLHTAYANSIELLETTNPMRLFKGFTMENETLIEELQSKMGQWLDARCKALEYKRNLAWMDDRLKLLNFLTSTMVVMFESASAISTLDQCYGSSYEIFLFSAFRSIRHGEKRFSRPFISKFLSSCLTDKNHLSSVDISHIRLLFQELSKYFFESMLLSVMRSLFDQHYVAFLFFAAVKSQISSNDISAEEWQYFLMEGKHHVPYGDEIPGTKKIVVETDDRIFFGGFGRHSMQNCRSSSKPMKPDYSWLSESSWESACRLSNVQALNRNIKYNSVVNSINSVPDEWRGYFESLNPIEYTGAENTFSDLSPFQRVLLIRIFRPSHLFLGILFFLKESFGTNLSIPLPVNVATIFELSHQHLPILLLTGSGDDPTHEIQEFATRTGYAQQVLSSQPSIQVIAPEDAKADFIANVLYDSFRDGRWLLLHNFHGSRFCEDIVTAVSEMNVADCHSNFRLWITTEPAKIPKSVHFLCMKIVWKPPASIRLNLIRYFTSNPISDPSFFNTFGNSGKFKRYLFALCFFHATLIERRESDPFGWPVNSNVDSFDLRSSILFLHDLVALHPHLSSSSLKSYIVETIYGCRFENTQDQTIVGIMASKQFSEKILEFGGSFDANGVYFIPEFLHLENFLAYAISLPNTAPSELLGLSFGLDLYSKEYRGSAEEILCMLEKVEHLSPNLDEICNIQPPPWLLEACMGLKINDILASLPKPLDMQRVQSVFEVSRIEARNRILHQETQVCNHLLALIKNSLLELKEGLAGSALFSREFENMSQDIFRGKVPDDWLKASAPTQRGLAAYIVSLRETSAYFSTWIRAGTPVETWMPAFYFPRALRIAAIANFARPLNLDIEMISTSFKIIPQTPTALHVPPAVGFYLTGIHISSCRWDPINEQLVVSNEKLDCSPLPVLQMIPCMCVSVGNEISKKDIFQCPLYRVLSSQDYSPKVPDFQNFVMFVPLPCKVLSGLPDEMLLSRSRLLIEPNQRPNILLDHC